VRRFRLDWGAWFGLVCTFGVVREGYFCLVHEPLTHQGRASVGAELEEMRRLIGGAPRVGYLSDQPLDTDPTQPRSSSNGDLMYAMAQYALAPTVLAYSGPDAPLVVACFNDPGRLESVVSSGSFEVLSRPRPNVALLRRK
jgi:hypothetical protein